MASFVRLLLWCGLVQLLLAVPSASAWHDKTHLLIAKAAGYEKWYNAAGADMIKIKADDVEKYNHWYNNNDNLVVTQATVTEQVKRYNAPRDTEGHLYGAILAAIRDYRTTKADGKYGDYHLALVAHYIGDLSNPLHNTPDDCFNKCDDRHKRNDGMVEEEISKPGEKLEEKLEEKIKEKIKIDEINLSQKDFEQELTMRIAEIANRSRELGLKMRKENRDMTKDEAYIQLGHSASLLKAVLKAVTANK